MQQCEKSEYFAMSLTADHSKVQRGAVRPSPTLTLWYATCDVSHVPATPMSVICPVITQHGTHCTALPHAHSSHCSIKLHRPRGPIAALRGKRPSVPSSDDIIRLMEKFVAHMLTYCDLHISRHPSPPILKGAKLSQIFWLVCEYVRYLLFLREQRNFNQTHEFCILQGTVVTFLRFGGQVHNHLHETSSGFYLSKIIQIRWFLTELFKK